MKKVAFVFLNISVFMLFMLYLLPKENLYYLLEQSLKKQSVVLSNETVDDKGLQLELSGATLFYKGIESADIGKIRFDVFLLYNAVVFKEIKLSTIAEAFIPLNIERIELKYTIFNPLHVVGKASGAFGEADIFLHLLDKKIRVILSPSEIMLQKYKNSLQKFIKSENGEYVYEQNI